MRDQLCGRQHAYGPPVAPGAASERSAVLVSGRLTMLSWLERRPDTQIGRLRWKTLRAKFEAGRWYTQSVLEALGALFLGERTVDAHRLARLWSKVADWLMLGGVLVVPVAAICAAIGALIPGNTGLHRHTGSIFAFAILWFITALFAAQFQRRRANDRATD